MTFDEAAFNSAQLTARTKDVPVPELAEFFKEEKNPVWQVRGLSGHEVALANLAVQKNSSIVALIEAITGGTKDEKTEAIKELLGVETEETPADLAKRISMLSHGSVVPECSESLAVRLASKFPVTFYTLTNEITTLTGLGAEVGKPKPSGKDQTSK